MEGYLPSNVGGDGSPTSCLIDCNSPVLYSGVGWTNGTDDNTGL